MSGPDPFEVLTGGRAPATLTREDRVRLLERAARLLMASETEEGVFVGGAIDAWLQEGGSLTRDYLRTAAPQGSTVTESTLYRRALLEALLEERQDAGPVRKIAPSPSKSERRK